MNKENKIIYSGFWRRVAAFILDTIFILLVLSPLLLLFVLSKSFIFTYMTFVTAIYMAWLPAAIISILYTSIQQSSKHQATFGMRIMSLKIHTDSMQKISFWRSFARVFASGSSCHHILAPLSICSIIFLDKKQALHDLVCSTVVTVESKKN
jgi:uncharacterized RDD family membrane protein YckC